MNPHRWRAVRSIFERVLAVEGEERSALLRELCNGDESLFGEVRSLLEYAVDDAFLAEPAAASGEDASLLRAVIGADDTAGDARTGDIGRDTVGPYRLIRRLGRGAMGVVYEAEQREPRRLVALKILRADEQSLGGGASAERLHRFHREAESLARLRHPGIAAVVEAGREPDGLCWIALELVRGRTLDVWMAERGAKVDVRSIAERIELVARVLDAVQAAHVRGVIHRDLKPANIMIDEEGAPRVLDFGLARIVDGSGTGWGAPGDALATEAGRVLGTLAYMSPEQAAGDPRDIDAQGDIYSVGLILYELLAGRRAVDVDGIALPEAIRRVSAVEPPRLGAMHPRLRGDIETIVTKAIAKDRRERYASASAFAADLRAFLAGEPIAARPPTTAYLVGKLLRRHHRIAIATCLAIAALLAVLALLLVQTSRLAASQSAQQATIAKLDEEAYRNGVANAALLIDWPNTRAACEVLDALKPEHRGWEWAWLRSQAPEPLWTARFPGARILAVREVGARLTIATAPMPPSSGLEEPESASIAGGVSIHTVVDGSIEPGARHLLDGEQVVSVAIGEGEAIFAGMKGGPIARFDAGPDGVQPRWTASTGFESVRPLALSPVAADGGQVLVAAEVSSDLPRALAAGVWILDATNGERLTFIDGVGMANDIAFDRHGNALIAGFRVVAGLGIGEIVEWSRAGGVRRYTLGSAPYAITVSDVDDALSVAFSDNSVRTLRRGRTPSGVPALGPSGPTSPVLGRHRSNLSGIVVDLGAAHGIATLTATVGGELCGWSRSGERVFAFSLDGRGPTSVGVRSDGQAWWAHRSEEELSLWSFPRGDGATGSANDFGIAAARATDATNADRSPDGSVLVTANERRLVAWDPVTLAERWSVPTERPRKVVALDATSALIASDDQLQIVISTDGADGQHAFHFEPIPLRAADAPASDESIHLLDVARSSTGTEVVTLLGDGELRLWRRGDDGQLRSLGPAAHLPDASRIAFDGGRLVVATNEPALWEGAVDARGIGTLVKRRQLAERPTAIALDGTATAIGLASGAIELSTDGAAWQRGQGHVQAVRSIAFGPGRDRLTSAGLDGSLRIWRAHDGAALLVLPGFGAPMVTATISPDERSIIAVWATAVRVLRPGGR